MLKVLKVSAPYKLGKCQGDCVNDASCQDGLECYTRIGFIDIPGCNGKGVEDVNYCYKKSDTTPPVLSRPTSGSAASPALGSLNKCEGQCDNDNECATGLKCFHRKGEMATMPVPGCGADASSFPGTGYCYDPIVLSEHNVFDFEGVLCPAPCQFTLKVAVTDAGIPDPGSCGTHCVAKTITSEIVVEIVDVNEPPRLTATAQTSFLLKQSYPENSQTGTLVATLDATDPDAGDTRSSLLFLIGEVRKTSGGSCQPGGAVLASNSWVSVAPSGELRALVPVNFEDNIDWKFCVDVKVQDVGGEDNKYRGADTNLQGRYQSIEVTVLDINEPPTIAASQAFSILENSLGGTKLKVVSPGNANDGQELPIEASDQDKDNVVQLTITNGAMYAGVTQFSVGKTDRYLRVGAGAKLDYELKPTYTLTVNVTDTVLYAAGSVVVQLTDVNEAPVVATGLTFPISEHNSGQATCTLARYCLPGSVVGTVTATDEDIVGGTRETFTFALDASTNTGSTFAIDANSGEITVATVSTELSTSNQVFNLKVVATDFRGKASIPTVVVVTVVEVNFAPDFALATSITMKDLPEIISPIPPSKIGVDLVVGTLEVVDPDSDYPLALSIKATVPPGFVSSFYLQAKDGAASNTKWDLVASAVGNFDYETNPSHKICVVLDVVDSKGATATYSDYCTDITDINEPPTLATQTFNADEGDITTPLKLGSLTATDPDAADDAGPTFAILPSSIAGGSPFTVTQTSTTRPFTWDVFLKPPGLNYETLKKDYGDNFNNANSRITCKVTLTDSVNPTVTYEFAIQVTDINEPPVITVPPVNALTIKESASVGAALGSPITVTDPDDVQRSMTFSIVNETSEQLSPAMVGVDTVGGNAVLKLLDSSWLDFEDGSSYDIVLVADDGGNGNVLQPPKQAKATLTITVTNVNDVVVSNVRYMSGTRSGHLTDGGDTVVISGRNFGPTPNKITKEKAQVVTPVVTYGAGRTINDATVYSDFSATNCQVRAAGNTEIECRTQKLDKQVKASSLKWVVQIGADKAAVPSLQTTAYEPPQITDISAVGLPAGAKGMTTAGGSDITITGTNFGTAPTFLKLSLGKVDYANALGTADIILSANLCVVTSDKEVKCKSSPGTGDALQFRLMTGGQLSNIFTSTLGYAPPTIATLSYGGSGSVSVDISKLLTTGDQEILITGTNFGKVGTVVGATYGGKYTAQECVVAKAHIEIKCKTQTGNGAGHSWTVSVTTGTQTRLSEASTDKTGYHPPTLSSVRGANIKDLRTEGGQEIVLQGMHFGAATGKDATGGDLNCADATRPTLAYGSPNTSTSVVKFGTGTELSAVCCKVVSAVLISCKSSEGVGQNFDWQVTVGGQLSNQLSTPPVLVGEQLQIKTGYAPPVLVMYNGDGSKDAITQGGQDVVIEGRNLGPAILPNGATLNAITSVTYGKDGTEYVVPTTQCAITTDHTFMTCKTMPGAGKGMKWLLTIDGQMSITPSTWYGRPSITNIKVGGTASELSTLGNELVTITGTNFGPSALEDGALKISPITNKAFLESVTYGPNGLEYAAKDCRVTVNSNEIECKTVPGVGGDLTWNVRVEGQQSDNFAYSDYQTPKIKSMAPKNGPTQGGPQVVIRGVGFGVRDQSSTVEVAFGPDMKVEAKTGVEDGVETVSITVPELSGTDISVSVHIKRPGLPTLVSNSVLFNYDKPVIDLLTSKWHDAAAGLLAVTADGKNFCKDASCGVLNVNGQRVTGDSVILWSHTKITFATALDTGTVQLEVGGQTSNNVEFSYLSPSLQSDTIAALKAAKYNTEGGTEVVVKGFFFGRELSVLRVSVGGTGSGCTESQITKQTDGCAEAKIVASTFKNGATIKDFDTMIVVVPPGQGKDQDFIVWRGKQPSPAGKLTYYRPTIKTVVATDATTGATIANPLSPTVGGMRVTITGTNFGINGFVRVGANQVATTIHSHTQVVFVVPAGEGKDLPLTLLAGNQQSEAGQTISYQAPTLGGFILSPPAGRRRRTAQMNVAGRRRMLLAASPSPSATSTTSPSPASTTAPSPASTATTPTTPTTITCPSIPPTVDTNQGVVEKTVLDPGPTVGGECVVIKGTNFGKNPPTVYFGPFKAVVTAQDTVKHEWVIVTSPPGEGAGLRLTVVAGTAESAQSIDVGYSYAPPTLTSISPTSGSTSGLDTSGQPVVVTIVGSNFGRPKDSASGGFEGVDREVRITPVCKKCAAEGRTPFAIRVNASQFQGTQSHTQLKFFMPEGYGIGSLVTFHVANQTSSEKVAFDYSKPRITKVTPYCGPKPFACGEPIDRFDTDGCTNIILWERYSDWKARKSSALKTVLGPEYDRKCGTALFGSDNDRWQMVVIEGSSLGSTALARSGAPLRVAVTRPGAGANGEDFQLDTDNLNCEECSHTHNRIVARSAWGYGRSLNITVALGESVSNPLPWSYKAPSITTIASSVGSAISAGGDGGIILRGSNFGRTNAPGKMRVRVFIGFDYDVRGKAVGYRDSSSKAIVDLAGKDASFVHALGNVDLLEGISMKECINVVVDELTKEETKSPARWHASYNYSVRGARNVDGHPYVTCSPQKDVSGPKNVTMILGTQVDSCATNYRLCADPISLEDRRMRKPVSYCENEILNTTATNSGTAVSVKKSECRDDTFCSWDCFSDSLFVSQCAAAQVGTVKGDTQYAKSGELCASVGETKAVCGDDTCMSLDTQAGFYRLSIDISCTRPPNDPDAVCDVAADGKTPLWKSPKAAARATGSNTEGNIPRCPVERWEPLLAEWQPKYSEYEGLTKAQTCYDIVSCHPRKACNASNVCSNQGYEYTLNACKFTMEKYGLGNTTCSSDTDCRTLGKNRNGQAPNEKSTVGPFDGEAPYSEPQANSLCVKTKGLDGKVSGQCQCTTSPRCAFCTVGASTYNIPQDSEFYTKGYFRLNGKCENCPDNPLALVIMFIGAIIAVCIGTWFLQKKQFNVAFISIGWDYFQVLALFSRAEIEWPPLMRAMFTFFSAFNFNIDITAPECLIPDFDYQIKWWGIMFLPILALGFLVVAFFGQVFVERIRGTQKKIGKQFSKIVALFLLMQYYLYLAVTRRALDIFNCNPSVPSDGYQYTEFTSTFCEGGLCKCWIEGSVQLRLVPYAIIFIIAYTLGFPAIVAFGLLRPGNAALIKEDQILRAHDVKDTRKTNPKAHDIRKRYHKMYYHFKPSKHYWILVIIFRKFAIAFIGLMFRANPGFQLAMCLLVLFGCYVLQVKHRPYMSNSERQMVIDEHHAKVQQHDDLRAKGLFVRPELAKHKRIHT